MIVYVIICSVSGTRRHPRRSCARLDDNHAE